MPTVAIEGPFTFRVNTRENRFEPPHVHVWVGNEDVCRIDLDNGTYMDEPPPGREGHPASIRKARPGHPAEVGSDPWEVSMAPLVAQLKNADRIMTMATAMSEGIELVFADGCKGVVPFEEIPEIGTLANLEGLELPNPYEVVLRDHKGVTVELPWDFVRHFCEPRYQARVEAIAEAGRQAIGKHLRELRKAAGRTQDDLASEAGISRVTLVRIEKGEQSPRYETLIALAKALGREPADLLVNAAPPPD